MKTLSVLLSFLLVLTGSYAIAQDIVVLHTNDMHARTEAGEGMGFAKLATLVERLRNEHEHVLLLDAGDTIHGTPMVNAGQGQVVVDAMNLLRYNAMVPGNHDFNFGGHRRLSELENVMEFPLLAANLLRNGDPLFKPYSIVQLGDYTVGIIGLVSESYPSIVNALFIRGLVVSDVAESAQRYVAELRSQGVDLVIALGHLGLDGEYASTGVLDQVSGIDLFVDGHSHDRLPTGLWHRDTLIVQAHEHLKSLGVVFVDMSGDQPTLTATLISAEEAGAIAEDPAMRELLDDARTRWLGGGE